MKIRGLKQDSGGQKALVSGLDNALQMPYEGLIQAVTKHYEGLGSAFSKPYSRFNKDFIRRFWFTPGRFSAP